MKTMYKKYNDSDLNKLKKDMIFVIESLDALCKKYDINYFAIGGTMLGAVRHNGFIPWDDDVDLGMLLEDYEKFLAIPSEEFKDFGLYAPEKNPGGYFSMVTKYYYKDSRFTIKLAKESGIDNMGIFVEIFPFFDLPENNSKIDLMYRRMELYKAMYSTLVVNKVVVYDKGVKAVIKKVVKKLLLAMLHIFRWTPEKVARCYTDTARRYTDKDAKYVASFSDVFNIQQKKIFKALDRVAFEDITMPIPKDYDLYLKRIYGDDYMTLPPEDKRWNQAAEYIRYIDGTEMKE